jgi:hypothetical protein
MSCIGLTPSDIMFRFTIRELILLTAIVAMGLGMYAAWQSDRAILALRLSREQVRAMKAENEAEELRQDRDKVTLQSNSLKRDDSVNRQPAEPEPAQHGLPIGTWKIDAFSVANTREVVPLTGSGQITISRARMELVWDNTQHFPKYNGYALSETDSQESERGIIRFNAVPDDPVRGFGGSGIPGSDWKQIFCGIAAISGDHVSIAFGDRCPSGFEPRRVTDFASDTDTAFFIRAQRVDSKQPSVPR